MGHSFMEYLHCKMKDKVVHFIKGQDTYTLKEVRMVDDFYQDRMEIIMYILWQRISRASLTYNSWKIE